MENFRGDYEQLAAVMRASWAGGRSSPYLYTAELLADLLRYPGTSFALAPAVYAGSELIAFAAGLPRQMQLADGGAQRVLIATLVTVAAGHKSSGHGTAVWIELVRRAQSAGYDGVVTYCANGQAMQRIIERCNREAAPPSVPIKSFSYLFRALGDGGGSRDPGIAPSARQLLDAAAGMPAPRRIWSEPEAQWQLSRLGAVAVSAGGGVLTGSVVIAADAPRSRYLVIDDVLWGSLETSRRQVLLGQLLDRAGARGASYAVVPLLGYADLRPFLAAGFQPTPHTMHAYLTMWPDRAAVPPAESLYLDVI